MRSVLRSLSICGVFAFAVAATSGEASAQQWVGGPGQFGGWGVGPGQVGQLGQFGQDPYGQWGTPGPVDPGQAGQGAPVGEEQARQMADSMIRLEIVFSDQFQRGEIDREQLQPHVTAVVGSAPDQTQPQVEMIINVVLDMAEEALPQLSPEERRQIATEEAREPGEEELEEEAERVGRVGQPIYGGYGIGGLGYGGYGGLGRGYGVTRGYGHGYGLTRSYGLSRGFGLGHGLGYGAIGGYLRPYGLTTLGFGGLGAFGFPGFFPGAFGVRSTYGAGLHGFPGIYGAGLGTYGFGLPSLLATRGLIAANVMRARLAPFMLWY